MSNMNVVFVSFCIMMITTAYRVWMPRCIFRLALIIECTVSVEMKTGPPSIHVDILAECHDSALSGAETKSSQPWLRGHTSVIMLALSIISIYSFGHLVNSVWAIKVIYHKIILYADTITQDIYHIYPSGRYIVYHSSALIQCLKSILKY